MNDITSKYRYVKQYIPDPQVKDVADQFCDAAELLWVQPPGSGFVVPAIINSVLAIELYLKSFTAYSVIKNLKDYGDGVSGGIVTVERQKSGKTGHELTDLFDETEDWVKNEFENRYSASRLYKAGSDFRTCLSAYDSVFVKVRYLYEDSSCFKGVDIGELRELMKLMRNMVESIPRKDKVFK
jgi:hypothetical protein